MPPVRTSQVFEFALSAESDAITCRDPNGHRWSYHPARLLHASVRSIVVSLHHLDGRVGTELNKVMARSDGGVALEFYSMQRLSRHPKQWSLLCLTNRKRRDICLLLTFLVPNALILRSLLWLHFEVLPRPYSSSSDASFGPSQVFETLISSLFPCTCQTTCDCSPYSRGRVASPARQLWNYSLFEPDYTSLAFASLATERSFARGRSIARSDADRFHELRRERLIRLDETTDSWDTYYEFYEEQTYPSKDNCYRPKWSYDNHPSCNSFHEAVHLDRQVGVAGNSMDVSFLGQGHFRLSFLFRDTSSGPPHDSDFVLKPIRLAEGHEFDPYTFDTVQLEALSMARSSASHRTIDIYGHCAASVLVEPGDEVYRKIRPEKLFIRQEELDKRHPPGTLSYNNLTDVEKLLMSLAMAEGLAEQHGNQDGVLINDDVQIQQFLVTRSGDLKLNDFNNVRPRKWNPIDGGYCPHKTRYGLLYRSPEERNHWPADESSDVYALGQVMYTVLTGMYPFYEAGSYREALKRNKEGQIPYVDPRYRASYVPRRLVKLMEQTWAVDRFARPSVFAVVRYLRETVRVYEAEHNASLSGWSFRSLVE